MDTDNDSPPSPDLRDFDTSGPLNWPPMPSPMEKMMYLAYSDADLAKRWWDDYVYAGIEDFRYAQDLLEAYEIPESRWFPIVREMAALRAEYEAQRIM